MDGIVDLEIAVDNLRSNYSCIDLEGIDDVEVAIDNVKSSAESLEAEVDYWYQEAQNNQNTIKDQEKIITDLQDMLEDIPSDEL